MYILTAVHIISSPLITAQFCGRSPDSLGGGVESELKTNALFFFWGLVIYVDSLEMGQCFINLNLCYQWQLLKCFIMLDWTGIPNNYSSNPSVIYTVGVKFGMCTEWANV